MWRYKWAHPLNFEVKSVYQNRKASPWPSRGGFTSWRDRIACSFIFQRTEVVTPGTDTEPEGATELAEL